jgi:hypothetical protein
MKKLRANGSEEMLATIRCRIFCLPVCYQKISVLRCNFVVLYGCEIWSLTCREENELGVFENRALRKVFGPERYEVTGEWRILNDEEFYDLYCSPNFVRVIKLRIMGWAGEVTSTDDRRGAYRILMGKPEGKRPPGRSRHR